MELTYSNINDKWEEKPSGQIVNKCDQLSRMELFTRIQYRMNFHAVPEYVQEELESKLYDIHPASLFDMLLYWNNANDYMTWYARL